MQRLFSALALSLVILTALPAFAAADPDTKSQAVTQDATQAAQVRIHPWWNLSDEYIKKFYEDGCRARRDGLWKLNRVPTFRPDKPVPLGNASSSIRVVEVQFFAPHYYLRVLGYRAEDENKSREQRLQEQNELKAGINTVTGFGVVLESASPKDALSQIDFLLETESGKRIPVLFESKLAVGTIDDRPLDANQGAYKVFFALRNQEQVPNITSRDGYIKLWILAPGGKQCITFWINGSERIQSGPPDDAD